MPVGPRDPGRRYGFAVAAVLVAWAVRAALAGLFGNHHPYPTFYVAAAAAAWYGGTGPALLAVGLGLLMAVWSFVPPFHELTIALANDQAGAFAFVVGGTLIAFLGGLLHEGRRLAEEQSAEAERRRLDAERFSAESIRAEDERRQLVDVVETSTDLIGLAAVDGPILYFNRAGLELLGLDSLDQARRMKFADFTWPANAQRLAEEMLPALEQDGRWEGEWTYRNVRTGQPVPVSKKVTLLRDPRTGKPAAFATVSRDITAHKFEEDRLRVLAAAGKVLGASLDYETTLAEVCRLVVPVLADWCAIDLWDGEARVRRLAVYHADPAKIELAEEFRHRYPPRPEDPGGMMKVLRTGEPELYPEITDQMIDQSARDPDHARIIHSLGLRSGLVVALSARGRILGALTLATSESRRRLGPADLALANELAARAALAVDNARLFAEARQAVDRHRTAEEQLALLTEASSSLSSSLDPPAVLDAVLALARRLVAADAYAVWRNRPETSQWSIDIAHGLSGDYCHDAIKLLEKTPALPVSTIVADDVMAQPMLADRRAVYEREGIRSLLCVPLRINGVTCGTLVFYFRTPHRFSPVEVRVGTALGNLAAAAIGSAELYEEVRDADRRKDEFLAMLAHELRNPLAPLRNALHILSVPDLGRGQGEQVRAMMARQVEHLVRMVDDLLDVSRLLRGKIELRPEPFDVAEAVRRAVETAQPVIDALGHELTVVLPAEPLPVRGDLVRLAQVFANLLNNAAKYTDRSGRIRIAAGREGGQVAVRVRDTGVGIAPDLLPKVFDLFVQADRSAARTQGGLGIGLTLVKRLVEMHGGTVEVRSDGPGQGSEFVVRLPPAEVELPPSVSTNGQVRVAARAGAPLRVLVVDDNVDAAESLAVVLRSVGHTVRTAHCGPAAVQVAAALRPEAVVLDIGLPGMDGYEVAQQLRRGPAAGASLIALTGYGQEEDRRRSKAAGFDHHLVKPVDPAVLTELLAGVAVAR
jgi:PAS domain S-box-containing protein